MPVFHYGIDPGRSITTQSVEAFGQLSFMLDNPYGGGSSPKSGTKGAVGAPMEGNGLYAPYCIVVFFPYTPDGSMTNLAFGADDPDNDVLDTGYSSGGAIA